MDDLKKWAIGVAGAIFIAGAAYAMESRFFLRAEFDQYTQTQAQQSVRAEIRNLDRRIVDVQAELAYGTLSPERRAQLEVVLALLIAQHAQLQNELQ